jgi:hypothetical protein
MSAKRVPWPTACLAPHVIAAHSTRAAASCFARTGRALSGSVDIEFFDQIDLSKAEIQAAANKDRRAT